MKQSWPKNLSRRPQRNNYTILLDSGLLTVPRLRNCLHEDVQGLTKQHQYHLTSWQKMTNQFTIQASLLSCTFGAKPPSSPTLQALSERAPASKLHAIEIQKQYICTSITRFLSYMQFSSCIHAFHGASWPYFFLITLFKVWYTSAPMIIASLKVDAPTGRIINSWHANLFPAWLPPLMTLKDGTGITNLSVGLPEIFASRAL